jgi:uncharacterized glyoxalase superfamily protein PhnB
MGSFPAHGQTLPVIIVLNSALYCTFLFWELGMTAKIVPMIHVPDVKATMDWYASIGFKVVRRNEEDGRIDWALLTFGDSELMLSLGGKPSDAFRREVDLYAHVDDVDGLFLRLKGKAEVVEEPHDTFYGMREFIIRDFDRF